MIKNLLQGKPFKHPLHPALVHFPIGLFMLSLFFDLVPLLGEAANWPVRAAFFSMALGVIMALLASVPGLVDWADIRADHPARQRATTHLLLSLVVIILYAVNLGLRAEALNEPATPLGLLLLSLVGAGLLGVSGYLGGTLIYDDGIAVGRHYRQTDTPGQTRHIPTSAGPDAFVTVASAASLADHETLRVEVNGHVMAIVNLNGRFYAFQEFCTHRYGPLSEGSFEDGQVRCPWHRSCFDVRTGQVTQGPAQVDLKTYEVRVQEGQIQVRVPLPLEAHAEESEKVIAH